MHGSLLKSVGDCEVVILNHQSSNIINQELAKAASGARVEAVFRTETKRQDPKDHWASFAFGNYM